MKKSFAFGDMEYTADSCGQIFGKRFSRPLKQKENSDGYLEVTLGCLDKRKRIKVHRIIAKLFVDGYKDGYEVNHKDFNRKNNDYKNLEWIPHIDNVRYSSKCGRYGLGRHSGVNNGRSKIKECDVIDIINRFNGGESISSISRSYNIGWTQTKRIINRESWNCVKV